MIWQQLIGYHGDSQGLFARPVYKRRIRTIVGMFRFRESPLIDAKGLRGLQKRGIVCSSGKFSSLNWGFWRTRSPKDWFILPVLHVGLKAVGYKPFSSSTPKRGSSTLAGSAWSIRSPF
jgi:hypothetical protein